VGRLIKQRNEILVKMPYAKETTRHSIDVWVPYDQDAMARVVEERWNIFTDEPIRDIAELFYVMRRVVNSDYARLDAIKGLLQDHDRLVVFYNFDYELDMLRELQVELIEEGSDIKYAEYNGHKHEEIPDAPRWLYVVQYIAGAEGWNCVSTNAVAFWSLTYSYKLWEQAHGRIDRLNTNFKDLYYYTLRSKADIDWAIWRSLKSKKHFQTEHYKMTNAEFAKFVIEKLPEGKP
jgi:hypothetical protein